MRKWLPGIVFAIAGCASVLPLTSGGEHVRLITAADAKACKFVQNVTYTDTLTGMGKSYGLVHQAGENGLRNAVAGVGANAYISTQADADWFWGHVNYSGEAYKCQP
jgi:uncharacterized protein DUF4156